MDAPGRTTRGRTATFRATPTWSVAWYGIVALLIASPLMRPGRLLLLDFALVRNVHIQWWPTLASPGPQNIAPAEAVLWVLARLGPVGAPILVLSIFFAAGIGMHRLVTQLLAPESRAPAFFAGTLYAVNPFVYERLMAGHLLLLAAYAIAPFLVISAVKFVQEPRARTAVTLAAFVTAIAWTDIHYLFMLPLLLAACLVFRREMWRAPVWRWLGVSVAIFAVANAWWIAGLTSAKAGEAITTNDLSIYATVPHSNKVIGSVAGLYGFWRHEWRLPRDGVRAWWMLLALIATLVVYGLLAGLRSREKRGFSAGLAILIPITIVLAAGISFSPTRGVFLWLFAHVPGFKIFREPEKWVALLVFAYAVLGAIGLERLMKLTSGWDRRALVAAALIVPLAYGNTLLWNWGRLRPIEFPRDWTTTDRLIVDRGGGRMLFLPWHLYISLSFTGYRVVNPAASFFRVPVLQGDNVEVGSIRTQSVNPESKKVESVLFNPAEQPSAAGVFASMCIRWVVLAKEFDSRAYDWLADVPGLQEVSNTSHLIVWQDELTPSTCR